VAGSTSRGREGLGRTKYASARGRPRLNLDTASAPHNRSTNARSGPSILVVYEASELGDATNNGGKHSLRVALNDWLDRARFYIDGYPSKASRLGSVAYTRYQPLPWVGRPSGARAESTYSRWRAIESALSNYPEKPRTARDLGCNAGFFTISLALEGIETVGIDPDPVFVRTAQYAIDRARADSASVWRLAIRPTNVSLLPTADVTIFLALWHHFVRLFGLKAAEEMLHEIWNGTRMAMFFETGEDDMPQSFGLPRMAPTPREWIHELLVKHCEGGVVRHLGTHTGFYGTPRNLYAVLRAGT
jgi:hypothetical protein